MQREKLFLSTVFLIFSLLASMESLRVFSALFADQNLAVILSMGFMLLLPLASLGALWLSNAASNYHLRSISFLALGFLLFVLGSLNLVLSHDTAKSPSMNLVAGLVCIAIGLHARKKALKKALAAASSSTVS